MLQASHTVASCKSLYYAKNRNQRSSDDIAFWKYVDPDYLKGCLEKYAHVVFARNVLDAEDDDDGDDDDGDDDDDDDDDDDGDDWMLDHNLPSPAPPPLHLLSSSHRLHLL